MGYAVEQRTAAFALVAVCAVLLATPTSVEAKRRGHSSAAIPSLTEEGLPNVLSDAAIAIDVDTGEILYGKNPDKVRAIASTGKIFVAMVARRRGIDLDAETEITSVDADYARGGARTRLHVGHRFKNIDLLRAMLVASDNRAPTAIGRAVGLEPDELIAEMNLLARQLGLRRTRFTDPSGLNGNQSTAREMARALRTALEDEVLAEVMGTRSIRVHSVASRPQAIDYRNTNVALHSESRDVFGGKTGYTDEARYCLVISAEVAGRNLTMAFLGAPHKLTRYGDFGRVADWIGAHLATTAGGEAATATSARAP